MGCSDLKAACLCGKKNFLYGIRDCSAQSCGAVERSNVLDWYYKELCGKFPNAPDLAPKLHPNPASLF
jgi:hypothetical protein